MKEYFVQVTAEFYKGYTVEADSEDEANEKAQESFNEEYGNDWDSLTLTAEEL